MYTNIICHLKRFDLWHNRYATFFSYPNRRTVHTYVAGESRTTKKRQTICWQHALNNHHENTTKCHHRDVTACSAPQYEVSASQTTTVLSTRLQVHICGEYLVYCCYCALCWYIGWAYRGVVVLVYWCVGGGVIADERICINTQTRRKSNQLSNACKSTGCTLFPLLSPLFALPSQTTRAFQLDNRINSHFVNSYRSLPLHFSLALCIFHTAHSFRLSVSPHKRYVVCARRCFSCVKF